MKKNIVLMSFVVLNQLLAGTSDSKLKYTEKLEKEVRSQKANGDLLLRLNEKGILLLGNQKTISDEALSGPVLITISL